jgi:aminoglycoside phosphotransferase (APT) family kinase protein
LGGSPRAKISAPSVFSVTSVSKAFLDEPTAVRPGEELSLAPLESFLLRNFPSDNGPLVVQQFPSGHSNLTYRIRFGDREMVLRRPPFGSKVKSAHDMAREYRVLSKLHSAFPAAPHVLLYSEDTSVIGAPFYLMEPIHGIILRKDPPPGMNFTPETARGLSEALVDNIARLHALDYGAIGLGDLGKPQGYLERQVRGWTERYYASKTHDYAVADQIAAWLQGHLPISTGASLVHNDYKYDNLVLDPAEVTRVIGILDWEMSTIGDPLSDLGTSLAYWVDAQDPDELQAVRWSPSSYPGSFTRAQIVERYAQKTGRDVSSMPYYLAFGRFKVAVILQQIYYRYAQGLTKDARFANIPERVATMLSASRRAAEARGF